MITLRPIHHPDQILSVNELKVGDKITFNNIYSGQGKVETIISFGYHPVGGELNTCFRTINFFGTINTKFHADYGLEPYSKGLWNKTNFTLKVKE